MLDFCWRIGYSYLGDGWFQNWVPQVLNWVNIVASIFLKCLATLSSTILEIYNIRIGVDFVQCLEDVKEVNPKKSIVPKLA